MLVHSRVTPDSNKFLDTHICIHLGGEKHWENTIYHMASSVRGQHEPDHALWLATQAGKMKLSCLLGTTCCIPQEKFPCKPYDISFIDQVCSVKMAGYWPRSFFCEFMDRDEPNSWSITHNYYMASSASGQDEPNRALWLATQAGKMERSCPLGATRSIPLAKFPLKPYKKSFIDQVCSLNMAGYWPRSFFAKKELGQYPAILTKQTWMNEWMCIYIPHISHSVSRRFTILLEWDWTSAC